MCIQNVFSALLIRSQMSHRWYYILINLNVKNCSNCTCSCKYTLTHTLVHVCMVVHVCRYKYRYIGRYVYTEIYVKIVT